MNKRDFLRLGGIAGLAALVPSKPVKAAPPAGECVLIPSETEGPFPLDLTENLTFFRQDLREDRQGVPLRVRLRVMGLGNCLPMENVRVNIWHCDKDGLYSGYSNNMNQGQAGKTYLRGYQITDADGEVEFLTIFPGWYNGRICHIHFRVYVSSSYAAVSQLTFEKQTKNELYAQHSSIYTKGADPLDYTQDNIFSDGYQQQLATLTYNAETEEYETFLELSVQGNGTTDVGHIEKENAKRFLLEQNYPNPYANKTVIPFTLKESAHVVLDLWDLAGRKVATLVDETRAPGRHTLPVDTAALGIANAGMIYRIQVHTADGVFATSKMMTAAK